jgi:hypothetical protein
MARIPRHKECGGGNGIRGDMAPACIILILLMFLAANGGAEIIFHGPRSAFKLFCRA